MLPFTKTRWLLIAKVFAVVLLAVSPRALLAPSNVFNRSQESRRPKTPKNIVRANVLRVANAERPGKGSKSSQPDLPFPQEQPWTSGLVLRHDLPPQAFIQLTKPDYLKSFTRSVPLSQTSPPA